MKLRAFLSISNTTRQNRIRGLLRDLDVLVRTGTKGQTLWQCLSSQSFDLVVIGRDELAEPEGKTVAAIRELPSTPWIIVLAKDATPLFRAELLAAGCGAILSPEVPEETMRNALAEVVDRRRHEAHLHQRTTELPEYRLGDFASSSPATRELLDIAKRVTEADTTILILGETGVGKEWLARAIHSEGKRAREPFVAVNCGAIPEGLVESHLFGHRAGSFTGATTDHRGYFEVAHGGTIFLDEIAEMPPHLQVRLLRVLQERAFQRVGSEKMIKVDVRVIAATHEDPGIEMREGRLREDLYYRIGVVTMHVPPLRDRREDIRSIAENHFEIFRAKLGRRLSHVEDEAMQALTLHSWPGNVRELINVMERAVLLANGPTVSVTDLPDEIRRTAVGDGAARIAAGTEFPGGPRSSGEVIERPFGEARQKCVDAFERQYLNALLLQHRGRVGAAAEHAGITSRALYDKMKRHGLRKEDFKKGV